MNKYGTYMYAFVVIADIIKSRQISNRRHFQEHLKDQLEKVNQNSSGLLSPYTITLGDEFQALYQLQSSADLLRDIMRILLNVYPLKIRFAVGYERIATKINREQSIGMDGPAFYQAREGLNAIKGLDISIIQFYGEIKNSLLINSALKLSMSVMNSWKKNTLFIFNELINASTVKKIAPKLHISERGIYKIIDTNNLREFVEYFLALEQTLGRNK
jgi:hypothetical protein